MSGSREAGRLGAREAWRVFAPFAAPYRFPIIGSVLLVFTGSLVGLLRPWPLKYLFDTVLIPDRGPASIEVALLLIAGAVIGIAALESGLSYLRQYVLTAIGQKVAFRIRTRLYEQLQRLSLAYHDRQQTGDLITRITRDVDKVQGLVTDNAINAGSNVLTLVGMFAVMVALDWQLAVAMLVVLPLVALANTKFRHRIRRNEQVVRAKEGEITSLAQETFSSIRVVKAFGREDFETDRFRAHNEEALDANLRVVRTEAGFAAAMNLLTAAALAVLVWFGAHRVLGGGLSAGDLLVFVSYGRDFIGPTRSLSKLSGDISRASVRAEKIANVLAEKPSVTDRPDAVPAPPLRGAVEFRSVGFAYSPGRPVLHDVSFSMPPGQVFALVGATGAGKSTIAGLLARLYDPTDGQVLVDGRDIRDYTLASLQAQISVVLQTSLLFHTSVRENIAYGRPDADLAAITEAAKIANVHDFIAALPDGYDTIVGERGDTLSGGQRQRIAIARAVVRDTPILLLDEPTTGLDARSEAQVLDALDRLMAGRTTVVIAHKLVTVRRADAILVVDGGRIVERGSHEELLRAGSHYAALARLQGLLPASRTLPASAS